MKGKKAKPAASSERPPPIFPIVGIGTSAGGLEALELFLRQVPSDCGMAFVIVQHLSPDHSGNLPELLQRYTTMKVQQVNDTITVLPNCVYVIPPNKDLTIGNRTLHLEAPNVKRGLRLPIDTLLRSLAADGTEQSIGVVLSGMGSDGTLGMLAIKEQGGLTLVQEPASAKFDSMPRSVIDAGYADIVAPAEELPARIIDFLGYAAPGREAKQGQQDMDQSHFEKIAAILKARTRHDFSLYKPTSVLRRIERRMSIHKLASLAEYARFLQKNSQEVELLFKELLIGVTSFFRDSVMWDELKTEALPKILASYPEGGTLRAWSCGCSRGEEAYSLAMLFREVLDQTQQPENYSLQIFATDLDADAIEKARRGIYPATITADVSPERLKRFFVKEDNSYRIDKNVREMVTFAQQNAIMDPPFTKLDILICRNLLIYLSTDLQKQLLPLFHYSLKPGGLLFLGSAETTGSQADLFSAVAVKSKLFSRSTTMLRNGAMTYPTTTTFNRPTSPYQESLMRNTVDGLQHLADALILHTSQHRRCWSMIRGTSFTSAEKPASTSNRPPAKPT
ncbi:MAG: chemotaxis protein CheB [Desulfuromonadales bacterium]